MNIISAILYDPLCSPIDRLGAARLRHRIASTVRGRVLEIGVGTGRTLPYYHEATEIVGIDPDPAAVRRAQSRADRAPIPVTLRIGEAEDLPFASRSFDSAVATFVLCTVSDPSKALEEVWRVLRPGGELRLLEHVRSPDAPIAALQDVLTPVWRSVSGGCHLNRDTLGVVRQAGFEVDRVESHLRGVVQLIFAHRPPIEQLRADQATMLQSGRPRRSNR